MNTYNRNVRISWSWLVTLIPIIILSWFIQEMYLSSQVDDMNTFHIGKTERDIIQGLLLFVSFLLYVIIYVYNYKRNGGRKNVQNHQAHILCSWLLTCLLGWLVAAEVYACEVLWHHNIEDVLSSLLGLSILFVVFFSMLRYVSVRQFMPYREDYLIPQVVRNQITKRINNMAVIRIALLLFFWPLFWLVPMPVIGIYAAAYCGGVFCVIILAFYATKTVAWIAEGSKLKAD